MSYGDRSKGWNGFSRIGLLIDWKWGGKVGGKIWVSVWAVVGNVDGVLFKVGVEGLAYDIY